MVKVPFPLMQPNSAWGCTWCHHHFFYRLLKYHFISQSHYQLKAAVTPSSVHLFNNSVALLASLFLVCFPSLHFFGSSIPWNSWEKSSLIWTFALALQICLSTIHYLIFHLLLSPHLFLGSVLIFPSIPPTPQYLFCPPFVPLFRLSPTNRDCVTSWLEPSSLG